MVATSRIEEWVGTEFFKVNGFVVDEVSPGNVVVRLPVVRPEHRGGGGSQSLNGGFVACLFDGALWAAVASAVIDRRRGDMQGVRVVTMNLNVNFLGAAFGDRFEAHARVVRAGSSVAFAEAELYDQEQAVCANATAVVRIFVSRDGH